MRNMSLKTIAEVCGGVYHGSDTLLSREVAGVVIDSRLVEKDFLFCAIRGQRVDGHSFIPDVMAKGALCALSEEDFPNADFTYIKVASCENALKALAAHYRSSLDIKVVGITGSVGKTSTKETIAAVLSKKYSVLKTAGNFNNEIGLPLTIFQIRDTHEVAVLEMGISHFGEMSRLAAMAKPDICVITNIGYCHLEFLGDRAGVMKAKTEMFDYMSENGSVIINGDDETLCNIKEVRGRKPLRFGMNEDNDFYAADVVSKGMKGMSCSLCLKGAEPLPVSIPVPGCHMIYNVLAAAAVGSVLGVSREQLEEALSELKTVQGRGKLIETERFTIMDDCYNANPMSMRASLDILSYASGRKVAILGDMFELGADERKLHREVGAYAARTEIDLLLCVGELAAEIADGAREVASVEPNPPGIFHFDTQEELLTELPALLKSGDTILVKASHGMNFQRIIGALGD